MQQKDKSCDFDSNGAAPQGKRMLIKGSDGALFPEKRANLQDDLSSTKDG